MIKNIKKLLFLISMRIFFSLSDTCIWLIIIIFPGEKVLKILKNRTWRALSINLNQLKKENFRKTFFKLINWRCNNFYFGSSCLSRSITSMIFLDIIKINNHLYIGVILSNKGKKVPHAWLEEANSGINITPGLDKFDGIILQKI